MIKHLGDFQLRTRILFGLGSIRTLGESAKGMGAQRYLLVSDPALDPLGIVEVAEQLLETSGLEGKTFDDVEPEPYLDGADNAATLGRELKADLVIGLGGGSAMDTAKAAAALMRNDGKAADYLGLNLLPQPGVPTIMIPTTAGTGSEVTFTAVFTNRETKAKGGINSVHMYPDTALLDPELTLSLPPDVTAATGMDALTHAIESFTGRSASVFTEGFALTAVRLIAENLRQAVYHGEDIVARENMLLGSVMGGISLADAGVGAAHALAYPLGGNYRVPHGLANAILIPYVMDFNLPAAERKFAMIAACMGVGSGDMPSREAAAWAVEAVGTLARDIGIPASIADLGIPRSDIPALVEAALKVTRPVENNPRPLNLEAATRIYERAFGS